MNPSSPIGIFSLGCIGALAPEVLRLYKLRNYKSRSWSWFYVVISIAFAGLGGTVAVILPATTYLAAFYAGVSMPLIINTILRNAGAGQMDPAAIERTEQEIKERSEMNPKARLAQESQDERGSVAGSLGGGFPARRLRLRVHNYISSL